MNIIWIPNRNQNNVGYSTITTAILDRIMDCVEVIHLNGDRYRIKYRSNIFDN